MKYILSQKEMDALTKKVYLDEAREKLVTTIAFVKERICYKSNSLELTDKYYICDNCPFGTEKGMGICDEEDELSE